MVKHTELQLFFQEVQKTYTHQQQKFAGAEQREGARS